MFHCYVMYSSYKMFLFAINEAHDIQLCVCNGGHKASRTCDPKIANSHCDLSVAHMVIT